MSQGQATGETPKEEAAARAPETNMAVEHEEQAAGGAEDALDCALEADDDVDLAFDEEVGFMRSVIQPAQVSLGLGMLSSLTWTSMYCIHLLAHMLYFTRLYRSVTNGMSASGR